MFPKLRFQEFDGAWSNSKIDDIAVVTSGGTPSRSNLTFWDGNIPWVTTSLVDFNIIQSAEEFITQKGLDNSSAKLFPKNTILMAMYGQGITRGKVAILGIDATTNQACAAIKLQSNYDTQFIFQNLMSRYEEIRDLSNDGGQKNLSAGIIKEIEVYYPEKTEQIKIASFLSVVDEKISQFNQKHELLSQYKQGMMQKLFSQQIRFKADDGSEFGEWQENQLLDLSTKKSSKVTAKDIEDNDGDYIVFGASGHFRNINSYTESEPYIAIVKDGAGAGRLFLMPEKSSVLGTLEIVKPNLNIQLNFLFYRMQLIDFSSYIKGSTIPHVYFKDYSQEKIYLPCLEEQTKIANFLSAIDQKIEVVAQQIEQAKQWKKGLLQQMFV